MASLIPNSHDHASPSILPESKSYTISQQHSFDVTTSSSPDLNKAAHSIFAALQKLEMVPKELNNRKGAIWIREVNNEIEEIDQICNRILEGRVGANASPLDTNMQMLSEKLQHLKKRIMLSDKAIEIKPLNHLINRIEKAGSKIEQVHLFHKRYLTYEGLHAQLKENMAQWGGEERALRTFSPLEYSFPGYQKVLANLDQLIQFQSEIGATLDLQTEDLSDKVNSAISQILVIQKQFLKALDSHFDRSLAAAREALQNANERLFNSTKDAYQENYIRYHEILSSIRLLEKQVSETASSFQPAIGTFESIKLDVLPIKSRFQTIWDLGRGILGRRTAKEISAEKISEARHRTNEQLTQMRDTLIHSVNNIKLYAFKLSKIMSPEDISKNQRIFQESFKTDPDADILKREFIQKLENIELELSTNFSEQTLIDSERELASIFLLTPESFAQTESKGLSRYDTVVVPLQKQIKELLSQRGSPLDLSTSPLEIYSQMIERSWQNLPIYQINTAEGTEAAKEIRAEALAEFDALRLTAEQESDAMLGKLSIPLTEEQQLKRATSDLLLHYINWSTSPTGFNVGTASRTAPTRPPTQDLTSSSSHQLFENESPAIAILSKESAHFQSQLLGIEPMIWNDKCYPIEGMESRIQKYMAEARKELEASIETDAELTGYGMKHMNLVKQARLVDKIGIPGLEVPLPKGIKSDAILNFLKIEAPDLFTNWKALDILFLQAADKETFFDNDAVKKHLSIIDQAIKSAFERADRFLPDSLLDWLDELKSWGDYLMVRSTGAEDSKDVVNAGGNESIAYVKPEKEAFCKAVGEVVRSYFSLLSLQNRVNAGQNPFEGPLKLAVTAQQLIGEPIGGTKIADEIPISLVVFSNEPLYVGKEKFRAMTISATYGHGEAVVQTKGIPTDAVLILVSEKQPDKLLIIYDNQYKPERLAPLYTDSGVELKPIPNPRELQTKPALNANLLARLYHWAVIGEKFFEDDATDMEIVVKNGQIYPVQARAIGRPPMLPNFIDSKKFMGIQPSPIILKVVGDVVVAGKASVEIIDDPAQLLFADTIEDAERLYRRGSRKLVVFSKEASETSHSVINFKTIGLPCLFVKNKDAMQRLIARISASTPLVACVQTGSLSLWDRNAVDPLTAVTDGFIVHPARVAQSLTQETRLQMAQVPNVLPEEIKELIFEINRAPTSKAASAKLEVLHRHPWVQRIKLRRAELEELAQKAKIVPRSVHQYIKTLEHLDTAIDEFFSEIRATLSKGISPQSLQSLLRVKIVDRLMLNSTPLDNVIGQYSLLDVDPLFNAARYQLAYQERLAHRSHVVDVLLDGTAAFTSEGFDKWQDFLLNIEPLVESGKISFPDLERFKNILTSMRQSNNLPTFITCFFALNRANEPAPISIFRKILADASSFNDQFISHLLTQQNQMRVMHAQIDQFAQPKSFDGAWKALKGQLEVFSDPKNTNVQDQAYELWNQFLQVTLGQFSPHASYNTVFQAASPMTRTIALQTMYELVELLDASIKALKLSPHFSEYEKLKRFKPMIQESMQLVERWTRQFTGPAVGEPQLTRLLDGYFLILQSILGKASDEDLKHLSPSFYFRVAGATLDSGSDLVYLLPVHLDDLFTLAHQNQLAILGVINRQLFSDRDVDKFYLPTTVKAFTSTLEETFSQHLKDAFEQRLGFFHEAYLKKNSLNKVGMRLNDQQTDIRYNVAIGQHSVQLVIRYDRYTNKVTFRAAFFGGNEFERWGTLRECTEIWQASDAVSFDIQLNDQEFIIERHVDSNEMMSRNFELLAYLIVATEYTPDKEALVERVFKSAKDVASKEKIISYFLENPSPFAKQIYAQIINENRQLSYPQSIIAVLYSNNQNMKTAIINFCQKRMLHPEIRVEDFLAEQTVSTAEKTLLHQIITAGLQNEEPLELMTAKLLINDHQNRLWLDDPANRKLKENFDNTLSTSADQGKDMLIEGVKQGQPEFIAAAIKLLLKGSPNLFVKYSYNELSLALVGQKRGIDEVVQWAKLAIVYPDREMINWGKDIFKALFTKGYAVDEALDALLIATNRGYLAYVSNIIKTSFSEVVKTLRDSNLIDTPSRLAKINELENQIEEIR